VPQGGHTGAIDTPARRDDSVGVLHRAGRPRAAVTRVVSGAIVTFVALALAAGPAAAVDTDIAISTTSVDFGEVDVGATAQVAVTLTNTGGDPFGPINMFGGAPPSAEHNAAQNCQGTTLPAGGSCRVTYSYSPGSVGTHVDTSGFTISETSSQSDGEDFTVTLTGVGIDPNAPTTTVATTTTTRPSTPATRATPAGNAPSDASETDGSVAPANPTTTTTTLGANALAAADRDDGGSGPSAWVIVLIVVLVIGAGGAVAALAFRRGQQTARAATGPDPAPESPDV
jgi:hypothetical protein